MTALDPGQKMTRVKLPWVTSVNPALVVLVDLYMESTVNLQAVIPEAKTGGWDGMGWDEGAYCSYRLAVPDIRAVGPISKTVQD